MNLPDDPNWFKIFIETYQVSSNNINQMQIQLNDFNNNVIQDIKLNDDEIKVVQEFIHYWKDLEHFTIENINQVIKKCMQNSSYKGKQFFMPIRKAITYHQKGSELAKVIYLIKQPIVEKRLKQWK